MIPGTTITLGGQDYIVPPLNFSALKRLQPTIESLSSLASGAATLSEQQIDGMVDIVHEALKRNYPDMDKSLILDALDLGNAHSVLTAILGASGITPMGERKAGASPSTGKGSTLT